MLFALALAGPFLLLLTLVVLFVACVVLVAVAGAIVATPYLLIRRLAGIDSLGHAGQRRPAQHPTGQRRDGAARCGSPWRERYHGPTAPLLHESAHEVVRVDALGGAEIDNAQHPVVRERLRGGQQGGVGRLERRALRACTASTSAMLESSGRSDGVTPPSGRSAAPRLRR